MATTLTAREMARRGGEVRRALQRGEQVHITFHDKPWARVVPDDFVDRLEGEIARLRAELARRAA